MESFIKRLDAHLATKGLKRLSYTSQWEMSLVGYVKEQKVHNINSVTTNNKACGIGKDFGLGKNKGGM